MHSAFNPDSGWIPAVIDGPAGDSSAHGGGTSKLTEYIDNTDPQVVEDATLIAFYCGILVFKIPFFRRNAASFGIIFYGGGFADPKTVLDHECGHREQLNALGWRDFARFYAIPSIMGNLIDRLGIIPFDFYYSQPWEYKADEFGGVNPSARHYLPGAKEASDSYFSWVQTVSRYTLW